MLRSILVAGLMAAVSVFAVAQARTSSLADFSPAAAAERTAGPSDPASPVSVGQRSTFLAARAGFPTDSPELPAAAPEATVGGATAPSAAEAAAPTERAAPTPTERPTPAPVRTSVPPTAPPAVIVPSAAPTAAACNLGSWFCYPRLGISGAIVPYTDCSGSTDVGTQIRSFSCLSDRYLMAHAYTQFGKITGWRAGDVVIAYGQQFTITGAFVQSSCTQPRLPLAPLEMQTSLTPNACGDVLVVQAR